MKIRKPLACSLHEIARIIGPERSEKDLIGILENILKDQDDEVKYGAIKNLSNFLTVFEHEKRDNLIDVFLQLQVI
jgi:serine/threonine-protein phosphatase 4 regulatory subunit 1